MQPLFLSSSLHNNLNCYTCYIYNLIIYCYICYIYITLLYINACHKKRHIAARRKTSQRSSSGYFQCLYWYMMDKDSYIMNSLYMYSCMINKDFIETIQHLTFTPNTINKWLYWHEIQLANKYTSLWSYICCVYICIYRYIVPDCPINIQTAVYWNIYMYV